MTSQSEHIMPVLDTHGIFHNLRLSNSKTNTFNRCAKKYEYKYVQGLRSIRKERPLYLGSWIHELLEAYYGVTLDGYNGEEWRDVHRANTKSFKALFPEEKEQLGDVPTDALRLFKSYLQRYGLEDRRNWKVIDVELDEIITLPNGLRFQIIVDLIVEEPDGGIWVVDHKNLSRFYEPDFMLLDAQLARYYWGLEHMGYGPLRGIMFNQIKTKPPTLPKQLQDGTLEKRANLQCDAFTYIRECKRLDIPIEGATLKYIKTLTARLDDWFYRARLPKSKSLTDRLMEELAWTAESIVHAEQQHQFPRSVSKDCTWDCEFKIPCQLELAGGDAEHAIKHNFTSRRKETDL